MSCIGCPYLRYIVGNELAVCWAVDLDEAWIFDPDQEDYFPCPLSLEE